MNNPTPSITTRDANFVPAFFASGSIIRAGKKVSTSPGTPVALTTQSIPCHHVVICAYLGNTGGVAVGDLANVVAEPVIPTKTGQGEQLVQGASTTIYVVDASLIYLDVASSGDGVSYAIYA